MSESQVVTDLFDWGMEMWFEDPKIRSHDSTDQTAQGFAHHRPLFISMSQIGARLDSK